MVWLWQIPEIAHVFATCKHSNHEYVNYIHPVYTLESVSNVYKWFVLTQTRKEILRVALPSLVSTLKWISENLVNQSDILCVASQVIQRKIAPVYRLKPKTLKLCHILCIFIILSYYFKFKYFSLIQLVAIFFIFFCSFATFSFSFNYHFYFFHLFLIG